MAKYKYIGQNSAGKKVKGEMTAGSHDDLYLKLREQDIFLIKEKEAQAEQKNFKLKSEVLSDFCRQLGTMTGAGISLVRALNIIANGENVKPKVKVIYDDILRLIRQGIPLSEAMQEQGTAFPELLINMIRSAEATGQLDNTAKRMAEHYTKEHKMNGKIKGATTYPKILTAMLVVVVAFIFSYIIPQFEEMFAEMDKLPLPTTIILACSDAIQKRWYIILSFILIVFIACRLLLRVPKVRRFVDLAKLRVPIVGKLLRTIYTARFARTLSSLYSSGIPMIQALQVGSRTIGNIYIEEQFEDVIRQVRAGEALSKSMSSIDGMENKLASTIMVGEETGSLDEMLNVIADSLEYDSEMAISRLVSLLEPLLIIVMGLVVGFIMIAVILPIYQSYGTIENSSY